MGNLMEAVGQPEGLVFISDRCKGLEEAVAKTYPGWEHRSCIRHIFKIFKKKFPGAYLQSLLWRATQSYKKEDFQQYMSEMEVANKTTYDLIKKVEYKEKVWSRSQFGTYVKCPFVTNNCSESYNAYINEARHFPIVSMVDTLRQKYVKIIYTRQTKVKQWTGVLVPLAKKWLSNTTRELGSYTIVRSTDDLAEVTSDKDRCIIDLGQKSCTCGMWQIIGLPCKHACVLHATLRGVVWENYVSEWYTIEKSKCAYATNISPMPDKISWVKEGGVVLPPKTKRKAGRPRLKRIKACDEPTKAQRRHKCKNCGILGYQARKCKEPILDQHSSPQRTLQETTGRGATTNVTNVSTSEAPTACSATGIPPILIVSGPELNLLGQVSGGNMP